MKKVIFLLTFSLTLSFCFSKEKINLDGLSFSSAYFEKISFENNRINIYKETDSGIKEGEYDYRITEENHMTYLNIAVDIKENKYLMVYNDEILILYNGDNKNPLFFGYEGGMKKVEFIYWGQGDWFDSSSCLSEKNIKYEASNLTWLRTKEPWVEGVEGYGIGEKIYLHTYGTSLYILNGFYSYEKPYLWEQNSRVKKIKIFFKSNPEYSPLEVELEDTSLIQKVVILPDFYDSLGTQEIEIEILDVYKGSKYKDTCINGIIVSCFE